MPGAARHGRLAVRVCRSIASRQISSQRDEKLIDYLICVGALARLTKVEATREALMRAESPAEYAQLLRDSSLLLE